jgi:hypothetical protein
LLELKLALDFIDFGEELAALGFDEIMSIYRPIFYAAKGNEIAKRKLIDDLGNVPFRECRIDSHQNGFLVLNSR